MFSNFTFHQHHSAAILGLNDFKGLSGLKKPLSPLKSFKPRIADHSDGVLVSERCKQPNSLLQTTMKLVFDAARDVSQTDRVHFGMK